MFHQFHLMMGHDFICFIKSFSILRTVLWPLDTHQKPPKIAQLLVDVVCPCVAPEDPQIAPLSSYKWTSFHPQEVATDQDWEIYIT